MQLVNLNPNLIAMIVMIRSYDKVREKIQKDTIKRVGLKRIKLF